MWDFGKVDLRCCFEEKRVREKDKKKMNLFSYEIENLTEVFENLRYALF